MKASDAEHARRATSRAPCLHDLVRGFALHRVVVHVEDARGLAHALDHRAEPQEAHRLLVQHGAAHQAQDQLRTTADAAIELLAVVPSTASGSLSRLSHRYSSLTSSQASSES